MDTFTAQDTIYTLCKISSLLVIKVDNAADFPKIIIYEQEIMV